MASSVGRVHSIQVCIEVMGKANVRFAYLISRFVIGVPAVLTKREGPDVRTRLPEVNVGEIEEETGYR